MCHIPAAACKIVTERLYVVVVKRFMRVWREEWECRYSKTVSCGLCITRCRGGISRAVASGSARYCLRGDCSLYRSDRSLGIVAAVADLSQLPVNHITRLFFLYL